MTIEFSVPSSRSKSRVIDELRAAGFRAEPGGVRLAYPFTVLVEDVAVADEPVVSGLVSRVEPCAGTIRSAASVG
ncbi:MAG: hypothetical protein WB767_15370 [Nocardioides sp.]